MNKNDIIKLAAIRASLPVSIQKDATEAFLCAIADMLRDENEVVIPDFGKFTVQEYAARSYRHPKTGKVETVPATKRVRFKPYSNIQLYDMKYGN